MAREIIKIKNAVESQLNKTNNVIASNEAIAVMVSRVGNTLTNISGDVLEINDSLSAINHSVDSGFDKLSDGLQELCFVFENGFMEITDKIALQNETLKEIKEILERPLDIQAKELRKRAEFAYLNNWIDEAEIDLLEAEKKNYQDFIVHQILGNIYFHHKKDYPLAIEYYQKSAKYALPVLKKHASNAFVCLAMIYYKLDKASDAYNATEKALDICFENSHALYHHARYSAKTGNEFISYLKKSIKKDPHYLVTADTDAIFFSVKEKIRKLAKDLRDEERKTVETLLKKINKKKKEAEEIEKRDVRILNEQIEEVKKIYPNNKHFDFQKDFLEPKTRAYDIYEKRLLQLTPFLNEQIVEIKKIYTRDGYLDLIDSKKLGQKTLLDFQKYCVDRNVAYNVFIESSLKFITDKTDNHLINLRNKEKECKIGILDDLLFNGLGLDEFNLKFIILVLLMLSFWPLTIIILLVLYFNKKNELFRARKNIKKNEKIITKLSEIKKYQNKIEKLVI